MRRLVQSDSFIRPCVWGMGGRLSALSRLARHTCRIECCCRGKRRNVLLEELDEEADAVELEEEVAEIDLAPPRRQRLADRHREMALPRPIEYPTKGPITTIATFIEREIDQAEAGGQHYHVLTARALDQAVGYPVPEPYVREALRIVEARRRMLIFRSHHSQDLVLDWRDENPDLLRVPDQVGEPEDGRHGLGGD